MSARARAKAKAYVKNLMADLRTKQRDKTKAALAKLTTDQIDSILADVHGGKAAGMTYGDIAAKHGLDVLLLVKLLDRYTDKTVHYHHHESIADAKAFRADRRARRKAVRDSFRNPTGSGDIPAADKPSTGGTNAAAPKENP